jgi:hypothetical protein
MANGGLGVVIQFDPWNDDPGPLGTIVEDRSTGLQFVSLGNGKTTSLKGFEQKYGVNPRTGQASTRYPSDLIARQPITEIDAPPAPAPPPPQYEAPSFVLEGALPEVVVNDLIAQGFRYDGTRWIPPAGSGLTLEDFQEGLRRSYARQGLIPQQASEQPAASFEATVDHSYEQQQAAEALAYEHALAQASQELATYGVVPEGQAPPPPRPAAPSVTDFRTAPSRITQGIPAATLARAREVITQPLGGGRFAAPEELSPGGDPARLAYQQAIAQASQELATYGAPPPRRSFFANVLDTVVGAASDVGTSIYDELRDFAGSRNVLQQQPTVDVTGSPLRPQVDVGATSRPVTLANVAEFSVDEQGNPVSRFFANDVRPYLGEQARQRFGNVALTRDLTTGEIGEAVTEALTPAAPLDVLASVAVPATADWIDAWRLLRSLDLIDDAGRIAAGVPPSRVDAALRTVGKSITDLVGTGVRGVEGAGDIVQATLRATGGRPGLGAGFFPGDRTGAFSNRRLGLPPSSVGAYDRASRRLDQPTGPIARGPEFPELREVPRTTEEMQFLGEGLRIDADELGLSSLGDLRTQAADLAANPKGRTAQQGVIDAQMFVRQTTEQNNAAQAFDLIADEYARATGTSPRLRARRDELERLMGELYHFTGEGMDYTFNWQVTRDIPRAEALELTPQAVPAGARAPARLFADTGIDDIVTRKPADVFETQPRFMGEQGGMQGGLFTPEESAATAGAGGYQPRMEETLAPPPATAQPPATTEIERTAREALESFKANPTDSRLSDYGVRYARVMRVDDALVQELIDSGFRGGRGVIEFLTKKGAEVFGPGPASTRTPQYSGPLAPASPTVGRLPAAPGTEFLERIEGDGIFGEIVRRPDGRIAGLIRDAETETALGNTLIGDSVDAIRARLRREIFGPDADPVRPVADVDDAAAATRRRTGRPAAMIDDAAPRSDPAFLQGAEQGRHTPAGEPNIGAFPRERISVNVADVSARPALFGGGDRSRVRAMTQDFEDGRFTPPSVVRDPENPERYIVYRGQNRLEAWRQVHGADSEVEVLVTDADISNPAQLRQLLTEAEAADFQTALPSFRERVRAITLRQSQGESDKSIAGRLSMSATDVTRLGDVRRLGEDVVERVITEPTVGPIAAELGRATREQGLNPRTARRVLSLLGGQAVQPTGRTVRETLHRLGSKVKRLSGEGILREIDQTQASITEPRVAGQGGAGARQRPARVSGMARTRDEAGIGIRPRAGTGAEGAPAPATPSAPPASPASTDYSPPTGFAAADRPSAFGPGYHGQGPPRVTTPPPPRGTTPPPPPTAATPPPGQAGAGAGRFVAPLRPFGEVVSEVVTNDSPAGRALARLGINPSLAQDSDLGRILTAYQRQRIAADELTQTALTAALDTHAQMFTGRLGGILPIDRDGLMTVTRGGVQGKAPWQDVFSKPGDFDLTSEQLAYVRDFRTVVDEVEAMRVSSGLRPLAKTGPEGWGYVPRQVKGVRGVEIRRPSSPRLQRIYDDAVEGYANGVRYERDPRATLELHVRAAYREVAEKQLNDAIEPLSVTLSDLVPKPVRDRLNAAIRNRRAVEREARRQVQAQAQAAGKAPMPSTFERRVASSPGMEAARREYTSAKNAYVRAKESARNREAADAGIFGGNVGDTIAIGTWRNRFLRREDVDRLNEVVGPRGTGRERTASWPARAVETGANYVRFLSTVGDFAAPFIQGLPTLGTNPATWARATARHYQAFFDPTVQARFIRDHLPAVQEMAQHGVPIGDAEFFAAVREGGGFSVEGLPGVRTGPGQAARGAARQGARQTIGRFQASYNTMLTATRTLLWEASRMDPQAKAQWIRNMTGALDSRALGVGPNQRALEGMWLAFSPRLLRSTVALVGDAMRPTTPQGRAALRALSGLAAGTVGVYVASGLALGKDWQEIQEGLNPLNGKRFLSHEVNGDWIGVGGQVRAITQLVANALANPEGFLTLDRWDNPLLAFYMSRGAPALNIGAGVIEATTGANAEPFEEIDSLPDLVLHIGTSALPFALQGALEGQEWETTGVSMVGARTSAETISEELGRKRDDAAGEMFGGKTYRDLTPAQQQRVDAGLSELEAEALEDRRRRGSEVASVQVENQEAREAMEERVTQHVDARMRRGEITGAEARALYDQAVRELARASEQRYADPAVQDEIAGWGEREDVTEAERATAAYFEIFEQPGVKDAFGNLNAEAYEAALDAWEQRFPGFSKSDVSPSKPLSPGHARLLEARRVIGESGWFDANDEAWDALRDLNPDVLQRYPTREAFEARLREVMGAGLSQSEYEQGILNALTKIGFYKVQNFYQGRILLEHQEIIPLLMEWGYSLSQGELKEAVRLAEHQQGEPDPEGELVEAQ